jgi:hypothetical protein
MILIALCFVDLNELVSEGLRSQKRGASGAGKRRKYIVGDSESAHKPRDFGEISAVLTGGGWCNVMLSPFWRCCRERSIIKKLALYREILCFFCFSLGQESLHSSGK